MQEILELGSRVRVEGRHGIFVVVYLNVDRQTADLMAMDGTQRLDCDVPLHILRTLAVTLFDSSSALN